jgi:hypothetical protein
MRNFAIIAFVSMYSIFFSQSLTFSEVFQTHKKNIPLAILNNHPRFFHVLRYNKIAHDLTIERRSKPSAAIVAFTALKMDSVNADGFNYENLNYLWYEYKNRQFFVFEKFVNLKRTVYLKIIDTACHSSGFIELAALEKDGNIKDFGFTFVRQGENELLIVGTLQYHNGVTMRSAVLYDAENLKGRRVVGTVRRVYSKCRTRSFLYQFQNKIFSDKGSIR